jgi:hypothetical protein
MTAMLSMYTLPNGAGGSASYSIMLDDLNAKLERLMASDFWSYIEVRNIRLNNVILAFTREADDKWYITNLSEG